MSVPLKPDFFLHSYQLKLVLMERQILPKSAYLLVLVIASFLLLSCAPAQDPITLGTFNIEWLGDNTPDDRKIRTETDDMRLREVLRDADADVLAVQEIENEQAFKRVLSAFSANKSDDKEYHFVMSTTGGKQRVGLLYRKPVELVQVREITRIAVEEGRTRAGLLGLFRVGNVEWFMLAVHLKSTSRADSTPELVERSHKLRTAQAAQLRAFADSLRQAQPSAALIIAGDFNDSPQKKHTALDTLKSAPNLVFLTADEKSCSLPRLPSIDHIVFNNQAMKRFVRGTLRTVNTRAMLSDADAERVSDHCPVLVQITVR
jgi:endonuclease/exonuclease/phosphatase family metal-dependent hydrolase